MKNYDMKKKILDLTVCFKESIRRSVKRILHGLFDLFKCGIIQFRESDCMRIVRIYGWTVVFLFIASIN